MTGQSRKVTKQRQHGSINIHEFSHRHVITTAGCTANLMSIAASQSNQTAIFGPSTQTLINTNCILKEFTMKWELVVNLLTDFNITL